MKLCVGIIEDALGRDAVFKNHADADPLFNLEFCEIYCGQPVLNRDTLYIARADALPPALTMQSGAAMVCVGIPSEVYTKSPLRLLVLDGAMSTDEISNKVSHIFKEYNALENRLYESVIKGRSVQYLIDLMAPYFNGNELFVNNHDFRFIGRSSPFCRLCEVTGIKQPDPEVLPAEVVTFFKNDVIFSNVRTIAEPFVYEPSVFAIKCLCMNVFHGGEFSCRVVVSEDRNKYRAYDAGLLRFFTSFIQLVFDMSELHGDIFPKNHTVDMFAALLRGEYVEKWRLENSVFQNGLRFGGPFVCASIMPSDGDFYNRTISFYCQVFNRDIKGAWSFEYDGAIVCVVNLEYYGASLERFAATYLATFRDEYFRVGYSNVFSDIMELRARYLQAGIALKTGLRKFPTQWNHTFADMVLHYMEHKLTEELDARFLCAPEILALHQYDAENQTNYLHTLTVYMDNQYNAVKTAKELFIHRTTMEYRLNRIEELTGIGLKDAGKMTYLYLSVKFFIKPENAKNSPNENLTG